MFIPSHSVGGGSTSQPGPSSQHKRPTQPNKYTFVDLTTPDPTPSPTKSNASPQQSSQGSNTTYKPPAQSQSSQSSYYDLIPLGSKQRPHPTFTRPAQSSQRSAFAPFPSYSSPAMSTSNNPAGLSKDRYLAQGDVNAPIDLTKGDPPGAGFGSSILKSKNSAPSRSNPSSQGQGRSFVDFIKPSSGAFTSTSTSAPHRFQPPQPASTGTVGRAPDKAWPSWLANPASQHNPLQAPGQSHAKAPQPIAVPDDEPQGEVFDLNKIEYNQADWERHQGDADEHMRELLSGAVGDGEDDMGEDKVQEGEDIVEGFADNVRLMPHQVRGVRWMRQRESARKYGGILADDMGLGKTVQTLARVVEGKATTAELKAGWKAGTLIIAPLAVMEQWATEVRSKTKPGALTVTTHHGPSRTKSGKTLQGFDVVITTFQTVASEYTSYKMEGSTQPHKQPSDDQLSSDDSLAEKLKKKKMPKKKGSHAVFDVKWLRVVV
ncbi:SNF2 family N-terminal domain-domain-containing protein, partial [Kockovaella imperatae]